MSMSQVAMGWTDMTGDIDLEDGFKAPDYSVYTEYIVQYDLEYSVVRRRVLHASQILMVERPRATW